MTPQVRQQYPLEFTSMRERFYEWIRKNGGLSLSPLKNPNEVFLPTTALQFFNVLYKYFPLHHVLLADFEYLPTNIPGRNAPVVSSKKIVGDVSVPVDYSTYLVLGKADIFFPTDFQYLAHAYTRLPLISNEDRQKQTNEIKNNRSVSLLKQSQFMFKYAPYAKVQTKSRFNPLLEDYANMSFFITQNNYS